MPKALNALMCKYGPYLIIGTLLVLVAFLQVQEYNSNIDALDQKVDHHLPRPKVSFKSGNNPSSYLTNAMSSKSAESMVFIVRTYKKYTDTKTAQRLLDGLEDQRCRGGDDKSREGESGCNLSVSVVMLPTDDDSRQIVEDETTSMQKSGKYRKLDVHLHKVENQVYADNCCQMEAMCHDELYAAAWNEHAYRKYRKYKDIPKKLATVCGGNNLLHYVVTDLALRYTVDSCVSDCDTKYVVMTNGDNTYDRNFVWKVMQKMKKDPSLDLVMTDYLERGVQYVAPAIRINQMDLGCMIFRVSSLKRIFPEGAMYLASLPQPNTWPDHYYGADGEFVMHLVHQRGIKVGKVSESLFTHW